MPATASVTKAHVYLTVLSADYTVRVGLYTNTSGNDGTLVASQELTVASGGTTGWQEITFTTPYSATIGDVLYLACRADDSANAVTWNYDTEAAGTPNIAWYGGAGQGFTWASFPPASFTAGGTYTTRRFAAYVTYE
jgi:hypothetical protein